MRIGERYYQGKHDILERKKTVVGPGGRLEECKHLQNSRVVDNQYARVVDQKVSYLLGKPLTIRTEREGFSGPLLELFGPDFQRKLRLVAEDALNAGIGWLHPCYDGRGNLKFRRIAPWELKPFWADDAKTELEGAIRVYQRERGGGMPADTVVEHFSPEGICCFVDCEGEFRMERGIRPYFASAEGAGVWPGVPLIPFRAGFREISLAGSPNQMAIQSMYADMDLDAGVMEIEFQAAFRELMSFVCAHLERSGMPGLSPGEVEVIFHWDVLINETENIENCIRSASILSRETILCQHPWTRDVEKEMRRIAGEATEKAARERKEISIWGVPM